MQNPRRARGYRGYSGAVQQPAVTPAPQQQLIGAASLPDLESAKRRSAIAKDTLAQILSTPTPQSWEEGLAKMAGSGLAGYMSYRAGQGEKEARNAMAEQERQVLAKLLGGGGDAVSGAGAQMDPMKKAALASQLMGPEYSPGTQAVAGGIIEQAFKKPAEKWSSLQQLPGGGYGQVNELTGEYKEVVNPVKQSGEKLYRVGNSLVTPEGEVVYEGQNSSSKLYNVKGRLVDADGNVIYEPPPSQYEGLFSGNSIQAQAYNVYAQLAQKKAEKGGLTPQEEFQFQIAVRELNKPQVITDPNTGAVISVPKQGLPEFGPGDMPTQNMAQGGIDQPQNALPGSPGSATTLYQPDPSMVKFANQDQANAALYSGRMNESDKILLETEMALANPVQLAMSSIPLVGNYAVSDKFQKAEQAKRDFINSTLRRESGAAISPAEFENAERQYFPRPGDSPEVIEQKRRNRQMAIQGIQQAAGPSYARSRQAQQLQQPTRTASGPTQQGPRGGQIVTDF